MSEKFFHPKTKTKEEEHYKEDATRKTCQEGSKKQKQLRTREKGPQGELGGT